MNLHIVPDNSFINKFTENLRELGLTANNRIVVRTNAPKLKSIRHDLPFAKLYSSAFESLVGDTGSYEKVFIHLFSPLLYRWIATHQFRQLGWMVWGVDLYNLPATSVPLYEPRTSSDYIRRNLSIAGLMYDLKVFLLHSRFRNAAYAKVTNVLTWMPGEYQFARENLSALKAGHEFFFYENDMPYEALDKTIAHGEASGRKSRPVYILGNSSTAELNHLDAVISMNDQRVQADLYVPVSYGDENYKKFLKRSLSAFKGGQVRFIDDYMGFKEYLQFLYDTDGLIMNNIRPQGYGNIFMMMYLGKKIFLNDKNLSAPDLTGAGLTWQPIAKMEGGKELKWEKNRDAVGRLLSHALLLDRYRELFG